MSALIRPSTEIATRLDFPDLWNRLGYDGVGVEIGTDRGAFAAHILEHWKGKLLQCIDPWATDLPGYDDVLCTGPRDADYHQAITTLSRIASHRVRIFRELSSEAVDHIVRPVDWVYVDGNHALEYVRRDLADYWPLIHWGGMLAGHDFGAPECPGVLQGVVEFAETMGIPVYVTRERTPYKSWYLYKPEAWEGEVEETLARLRTPKTTEPEEPEEREEAQAETETEAAQHNLDPNEKAGEQEEEREEVFAAPRESEEKPEVPPVEEETL
jgi:hypothetical protein